MASATVRRLVPLFTSVATGTSIVSVMTRLSILLKWLTMSVVRKVASRPTLS